MTSTTTSQTDLAWIEAQKPKAAGGEQETTANSAALNTGIGGGGDGGY